MNQEIESLAELSAKLMSAPPSSYGPLLARRRAALNQLASRQESLYATKELASALRAGRDARSHLLVELSSLRAKIEELQRLRTGLGQLRPVDAATPSLDVRL